MTKSEEQHLSLQKALQQCELVQNMIDISISSLEGLRTKCATSNDLTQKEIRTLEVRRPKSLLCISIWINTEGCHRLLFIPRPLCTFSATYCFFFSSTIFLFLFVACVVCCTDVRKKDVPLKKPDAICVVQCNKSGGCTGAAVGLLESCAFCRWRGEKVALLHQNNIWGSRGL